jgi:hypothetical protein
MKIGIFYNTCSTNSLKYEYMKCFAEGVFTVNDDKVIEVFSNKYVECDIAVIFGFFSKYDLSKKGAMRKSIYDAHTARRKKCIFIDTDIFKNSSKLFEDDDFCRVSYNSIFFDRAIHFNEIYDNTRWEDIKKIKQIEVKNYISDFSKPILISANSTTGWSNLGTNPYDWIKHTIKNIKNYSNNPIALRLHPKASGDIFSKAPIDEFLKIDKNIIFMGGVNEDLLYQKDVTIKTISKDISACVVHTSSSCVEFLINGIPIFTNSTSCCAHSVANHNIKKISKPELPKRDIWFNQNAHIIWSKEELRTGKVWLKFRSRLDKHGDIPPRQSLRLRKRS